MLLEGKTSREKIGWVYSGVSIRVPFQARARARADAMSVLASRSLFAGCAPAIPSSRGQARFGVSVVTSAFSVTERERERSEGEEFLAGTRAKFND